MNSSPKIPTLALTLPKELRTPEGHKISREEVKRAMYSPGDGQVTRCFGSG